MTVRTILIVVSLGLSALVVCQWTRESALRGELAEMDVRLKSSEAEAGDLRDKLRSWEQEIARLTELSRTATTRAEEQQAEITRLTGLLTARDAALAAPAALPPDYAANLKARNDEVTKQNEAIVRQNAALQKVVRERDDLADRLNARTREFNDLTLKYNKLAR